MWCPWYRHGEIVYLISRLAGFGLTLNAHTVTTWCRRERCRLSPYASLSIRSAIVTPHGSDKFSENCKIRAAWRFSFAGCNRGNMSCWSFCLCIRFKVDKRKVCFLRFQDGNMAQLVRCVFFAPLGLQCIKDQCYITMRCKWWNYCAGDGSCQS